MATNHDMLLLGAVAYDPKTVTIWEGFRAWFVAQGLPFDFMLFSNYERQVEALLSGAIDVAWNSPLAWVRSRRMAEAQGKQAHALAMRDSDRDLRAVTLARSDAGIGSAEDLAGKTVATGAVDSPQATLIPLSSLRAQGATNLTVRRFDIGVGKHGDHIGGEGDAARALLRGEVDAACVMDATRLMLQREGVVQPGETKIIAQTPLFDHCNMTAIGLTPTLERFTELLLNQSYDDPAVRPLLDLEGLKAWLPGRTEGYRPLEAAVDEAHFYDARGNIAAGDYRP